MAEIRCCRCCGGQELVPILDLGRQPLPDALVSAERLHAPEAQFPLRVVFCPACTLVQHTEDLSQEELFDAEYRYFSSFSPALLEHSLTHAKEVLSRLDLGPQHTVVEVASNDGYLLKGFADAGVGVLGIEPSPRPAAAARQIGIPTRSEFFGLDLARQLRSEGVRADVLLANNVMAHVPDLNSFMAGIAHLLAEDGIAHIENPSLAELVERCAFDTIYLEHFCYWSCTSVQALAERHGLFLNDVSYFPDLHGGTLRWELARSPAPSPQVGRMLAQEQASGLTGPGYYTGFAERVVALRDRLREILIDLRERGGTVAAYGAAAKGSTMLNFAGLGTDLVEYVVDRNPHKHGWFMPGTHQPILEPGTLLERRPTAVLLLTWNFAEEIIEQQREYLAGGGAFVVPVPEPRMVR